MARLANDSDCGSWIMKKSFDAVGWMRKRRMEIDRETEGLSWEERSQRIRKSLEGDPLWERLKNCTTPQTPHTSTRSEAR